MLRMASRVSKISEQSMVGTSKILTVSYGTFSCTLEGFDDSFGTMKAIAEYFRDLAADDRYFGAEPPTPDADMLQRIAEREIHKRVSARIEGESVVLRPDAETDDAVAEDAPPPAQPAPVAPVEAPKPAPAARKHVTVKETDNEDEVASVAAKLARIRAAVDTARVDTPTDQDAYTEDQHASESFAPDEDAPDVLDDDILEVETEVEAEVEETPAPVIDAEMDFDTGMDEIDADDALTSIEAVEAEAAPEIEIEEPDLDEVSLDTIAAALATEEPVAPSAPATDVSAEMADLIGVSDEASEDDVVTASKEDAEDDLIQGNATPAVEEQDDDEDALITAVAEITAEEEPKTAEAEKPEVKAAAARARARVLKVKRADLEEFQRAREDFEKQNAAPVEPEATVTTPEDDGTLSPEDEADLMAELAAAERDARQEAEEAQVEDAPIAEDAPAQPERPRGGVDVSRLVDEVNTKMDGPDQKRRRSAIAHLKAAVAATVAERGVRDRATTEREREEEAEVQRVPYRRDLETAVNKGDKAMAPLVLVSSQRVDKLEPAKSTDAPKSRPRPVAAAAAGNLALQQDDEDDDQGTDNIFADDHGSFAEFVEKVGARGLEELLEAAAAYTSVVEGADQFTRPQVMQAVKTHLGKGDFQREDSLKAFGKLLREGPFERVSRGQFAISKSSRYMRG